MYLIVALAQGRAHAADDRYDGFCSVSTSEGAWVTLPLPIPTRVRRVSVIQTTMMF